MQPEMTRAGPAASVALFGEVLADVFPDQSVLGGAPFNVARHLRAFGLHPVLISRTGGDALREELLQAMTQLGMEPSGIQRDADRPTGQVRVVLDHGSHQFDILPDQAYDHICAEATDQIVTATQPRLAYFGTLAQRSAQSRLAVARFVERCECPLFLDVNLRAPWYDETIIADSLAAADIVKLNEDELALIAGMFGLADEPPEAQARALQQRFALHQLLVTCGAAGSWLLDAWQQVTRVAPITLGPAVVDTVGAGDAYAAVFMLGLLRQWDVPTTLQRASAYAAAVCGVRGAAPPAAAVLQALRRDWQLEMAS